MSLRAEIGRLLRGERNECLLHNTRLEGFGGEVFGEEAIRQQFAGNRHELSDGADWLESAQQIALFDDRGAVFADRVGDRLTRMWRLGPARTPLAPEQRVDVPFDADLRQQRGDVFLRPEDHPELDEDAVPALIEAGTTLLDDGELRPYRARAFAIRAFGRADDLAALFALHTLSGDETRASGFSYAAVRVRGARTFIVRDMAGEVAVAAKGWRPQL